MIEGLVGRVGSHLKLTFYLCLLTAAAVGLFLQDSPAAAAVLPLVYQWSVIGYYGTLLLTAAVLTLPLSAFRLTRWLWPLLGWAWLVYLAIDVTVFQLYRFHLDWLMVEMFLRDFRGMGIPAFLLIAFALLALVLLGFVLWLYASRRTGQRHHWPWFALGLLLMPVALAINSTINIWAARYVRDEITRYRPYLPLYYPVEFYSAGDSISERWPAIFPAAYGKSDESMETGSGIIRYPLSPLQCKPSANAPSILMIVLESW